MFLLSVSALGLGLAHPGAEPGSDLAEADSLCPAPASLDLLFFVEDFSVVFDFFFSTLSLFGASKF